MELAAFQIRLHAPRLSIGRVLLSGYALKKHVKTVDNWQCRYCDKTLTAQSPGEANRAGRDHLMEEHRAELVDQYAPKLAGKACQSSYGYEFDRNPQALDDLVCPGCETDNLGYFADKDVWAGIEKE